MDRLIPHMQQLKLGLHITQAVFIFVAWVLTIVYFRQATIYGTDISWYFAMCFVSIPAIIYQTLTPMFNRSRRWGHPYAFATVDVLFTVLWLSAWAAVAAWNLEAQCSGACTESEAMVGLGFMVFFFFALTAAISIYGIIYWRQHGTLPGASDRDTTTFDQIDPDREAFSTAIHDDYTGPHVNDKDSFHGGTSDGASGVGLGLGTEHGSQQTPYGYDSDTSYGGASASTGAGGYSSTPLRTYSPPEHELTMPQPYATPAAWEETGANSTTGVSVGVGGHERVQFPPANY